MFFALTRFGFVRYVRLQILLLRWRIMLPRHAKKISPLHVHATSGILALLFLVISAAIPVYARTDEEAIVVGEQVQQVAMKAPASGVLSSIAMDVNDGERLRAERGVFLTPNSMADKEFLYWTIERLKKTGGNAIIFDVKGSQVHFESEVPMAKELGLIDPSYNLSEVIQILRDQNIRGIARYIAVKDGGITQKRPDTQLHNPAGHVVSPHWVDPGNPDVLAYNSEIICELAAAGIEEINLDYIRFRPEDAEKLSFLTREERAGKIEAFVRMARETIDRCGPQTRLGISTFAILGWAHDANANIIGQDITRLAPLVDVISPMAYNANFSLERYWPPVEFNGGRWAWLPYRTLTGYAELLGDDKDKLRPWLQGFNVTRDDMIDQMRGVYQAGVCGFTFWNAHNAYVDTYAAFKRVPVPEECVTR